MRAVPKMQISVKQQYSWRLEQKASFRLIGKSIRVSRRNEKHKIRIPEFWSECQKDGSFSQMISMDSGTPKGLFGLFQWDVKRPNEVDYSIMVKADIELRSGYTELLIPEATWAVFDCVGPVPQAIQNGWNYLQEEWLVRYPFQHARCPELEWYSDGNAYAKDYLSQIWIPVIDSKQ